MKTKLRNPQSDLATLAACPCCGELPETLYPLPTGWSHDDENLWCPIWDFDVSHVGPLGVIQAEDVQAANDLLKAP